MRWKTFAALHVHRELHRLCEAKRRLSLPPPDPQQQSLRQVAVEAEDAADGGGFQFTERKALSPFELFRRKCLRRDTGTGRLINAAHWKDVHTEWRSLPKSQKDCYHTQAECTTELALANRRLYARARADASASSASAGACQRALADRAEGAALVTLAGAGGPIAVQQTYPPISETGQFLSLNGPRPQSSSDALRELDAAAVENFMATRKTSVTRVGDEFATSQKAVGFAAKTFPKRVVYPRQCGGNCKNELPSRRHMHDKVMNWLAAIVKDVGVSKVIFADIVVGVECVLSHGEEVRAWAHLATASAQVGVAKARNNMVMFDELVQTGEGVAGIRLQYAREDFVALKDPCSPSEPWRLKSLFDELNDFGIGHRYIMVLVALFLCMIRCVSLILHYLQFALQAKTKHVL